MSTAESRANCHPEKKEDALELSGIIWNQQRSLNAFKKVLKLLILAETIFCPDRAH